MPFQTIFTVPYVYETQVLRRRHRIAERIWLRNSTPVQVLELEGWEAPVSLTASLEHPRHKTKRIVLRHDGKSYLRPVEVEPSSGRKAAVYFTRADLEEMLMLEGPEPPSRFDAPKAWLTFEDSRFQTGPFGRPVGPLLNEIKTVDETVDVKDWLSSAEDAAKAQRAAVAEADEYVLVDGDLHRRTAAPMLAWFSFRSIRHPKADDAETPVMVDAAEFFEITADKEAEGAWWNWWPVSAPSGFIGMTQGSEWKLEIEAPLEIGSVADLIRVGRTIIPRIQHYLSGAVEHLSDAGLEHFRAYRAHRARGLVDAGDAPALVAAMESARDLAKDIGFGSDERPVRLLSELIKGELTHWDELLLSLSMGMSPRDEEAIFALAKL